MVLTISCSVLAMFISGLLMGIAITGIDVKWLHPAIGVPFAFAFAVGVVVAILFKLK